jgi:hypothetical protein
MEDFATIAQNSQMEILRNQLCYAHKSKDDRKQIKTTEKKTKKIKYERVAICDCASIHLAVSVVHICLGQTNLQ